jgi:RNA polymerase sigma-70 factor (ECF subfamily)
MNFSELDDQQLLDFALSAMDGDVRAFTELVRRNQAWVRANCRHITRGGEEEDLAQEVFLKAYFGLEKFQGKASFKTWVGKIKANHCLNHLRKLNARPKATDELTEINEDLIAVDPKAPAALAMADEQRRIEAILDQMSDTLRVPLVLCDMDEMSYQEIADLLGLGLSAVKMRIKRARDEFRRRLDGGEPSLETP